MMLTRLLKILLLSFCLLIVNTAFNQTITVDTHLYDEENGLSRYANYIHKDNRGIIWVGTQYGLYRFDGLGFTVFNENAGLPFRQIMEIYEDTDGWLWLYKSCLYKPLCQKDLAFFHPLTQEVQTFEQRFGKQLSVQPDEIVSIAQDSLNIYFTADHKFITWSSEKGIQERPIKGLTKTPELLNKVNEQVFGAFYVEGESQAERFNISKGIKYIAFDIDGNLNKPAKLIDIEGVTVDRLRKICQHAFQFKELRFRNHELLINDEGTLTINRLHKEMPYTSIQEMYLDGQVYIDEQGRIFYAGLGVISKAEEIYSNKNKGENTQQRLGVFAWVKDRENNSPRDSLFRKIIINRSQRHQFFDHETQVAWVARARGVKTFHYKREQFDAAMDSWPSQLATGIISLDKDQVLMSTLKDWGIHKRANDGNHSFVKLPQENRPTFLIHNEGDPYIWGKNHKTFFKIDRTNFSCSKFPIENQGVLKNILFKNDHQLWISGERGLSFFDTEINQFIESKQFNRLDSIKVHFVKQFGEHLWIGTDDGLFIGSEEKGIQYHLNNNERNPLFLPANRFLDLLKSKDGGYWLATLEGLIYLKIDERNLSSGSPQELPFTYRRYSREDGLLTNELLGVYEDDYGFLWIPTPHGLIQFQKHTQQSKAYQKSDGLTNSGFQEGAHLQAADGTLYMGGYQGYNIFHPKDFKDVSFNAEVPLVIMEYEQYNSQNNQIENRLSSLLKDQQITLEPGNKLFNMRVVLADYRAADKHRIAYKVEGYQEEWNEDKSSLIRISGLPYGDFTLRIKGRLASGQYTQPELLIPIRVLRPFYFQKWFVLSCIIMGLFCCISWFQWRVRAMKKKQVLLETAIGNATKTIRQKNEKLQNLDKIKSRFFANVSHELRTPLTLLLAPLSSMLKSQQLDNKNFTLAKMAQQNTQQLLKLVNEILDLTKLDSEKMELQEENVPLYFLIQRILSAFESHAQRHEINFEFKSNFDQYLQIRLDAGKFEKILNNLLSNAFKFTANGGSIAVSIEDLASHIQIEVKDTGRGIHPDDLPEIFNRFYQSAQADTPTEGGTGIGLSLCMELGKLMEGDLWAESTEGVGSRFYFKFPKKQVLGFPDEEWLKKSSLMLQENTSLLENNLGHLINKIGKENRQEEVIIYEGEQLRPRVLIVEDNRSLRDYLGLIIREHYQVFSAANGKLAWEALTRVGEEGALLDRMPDLIISDIMMPEMDGYQLLEKLKSNDSLYHIPVIMLTARAEMEDKLNALRIGVDDYMLKPFEEEELLARAENLLKHAKRRQTAVAEVPALEIAEEKALAFTHSKEDMEWLTRLEKEVLNGLVRFDFSVTDLSQTLMTNRWQLNTRIKEITGLTASHYIQEVRLNHARQLLESGETKTVKRVAYEVGMKDVKYFSRQFKKRFGKSPSAYL